MRDDRLRYEDILEALERIRKYAVRGRDAFFADKLLQVWVIHHLQTIGEALAGLSPGQRTANETWARPIIAIRNILVHPYFN